MPTIIQVLCYIVFAIFLFAAICWVFFQLFKPRDTPELTGWQYGEMLDPFDPHYGA